MERISSVNNPRIKQWSSLLKKKARDESRLFLLEGLTSILEAVRHGGIIDTIVLLDDSRLETERLDEIIAAYNEEGKKQPETIYVTDQVLNKLTETQSPQGIVAVVRQPDYNLDDLSLDGKGTIVVIDGIQDPGNLGTIIRTADAAGAKAVILGEGTVDLYNPKVVRSTMGSIFHLPIIKTELENAMQQLKNSGVTVVGTRLAESEYHHNYSYPDQTAIVVGNEAKGVSPSIAEHVDQWVKIPMIGAAESLNVAIATAVILYEAVRQHSR